MNTNKICWICKQSKKIDEFGNNKRKKDGKQGYCKLCGREKDKKHYLGSSSRKNKIKEDNQFRKERNQQFVLQYLIEHPCVDCGETDVVVLEFDHRDNEEKESNISNLISHGATLDRLLNEINKCDIRCANDHKRRTAKQFGWYKSAGVA